MRLAAGHTCSPSRTTASTLYVGLDGAYAVRRINLTTLQPELQFTLGQSLYGEAFMAAAMAVLPGTPGSVAVARGANGTGGLISVAIFDDGVARLNVTPETYASSALAFSASASRLYGFDTWTTGAALTRMNVDATGVTVADSAGTFFPSFSRAITQAGGLLYASSGTVGDPERLTLESVLPGSSSPINRYYEGVAPDPGRSRIFAVDTAGAVHAFDHQTLRPLWSVGTGVSSSAGLVECGDACLAFRGSGKMVVIGFAGTRALQIAVRGTGNGKVTSVPAGISCGYWASNSPSGADCDYLFQEGRTVTLTAVPNPDSRFVGWTGGPACTSGVVAMTNDTLCTAAFEQVNPGMLQVPIASRDLAFSTLTGKLYVSVPGWDPVIGNTITEIDPATGAIGRSLGVGSEPNRLALSDDGRYLYVGLDGSASVQRVDLSTFVTDISCMVGRDSFSGFYLATDLVVQPGSPQVVAVARGMVNQAGGQFGLAVFDNSAQRPTVANGAFSGLVFGATPSTLYGFSGSQFVRMAVGPTGASIVDTPGYTGDNARSVLAGGLVHNGNLVVDPMTPALAATFPASFDTPARGLLAVAVDTAARRRYALASPGFDSIPEIQAFDLDTLRPLWQIAVPAAQQAAEPLMNLGGGHLAFRTDCAQVFLADTSGGQPLTVTKGGTGNGTVASSPAGISCDTTCAALMLPGSTVTLTATPNASSIFVGWTGDAACLGGVVTMSTPHTCTAVFAQLDYGLGVQLPLETNDLAYSTVTGKVYASIPGRALGLGNTITVIDPVTGAIGPSIWVGSEPNKLAMSSDGLTLYVGLDGSAAVRPFAVSTLTPGTPFSLGEANGAVGMVVVPADSASVVVSRTNDTAVFSSGVARAGVGRHSYDPLAFGASSTRVYGGWYGNLIRADIGPGGVTELDSTFLPNTDGQGFRFDHARLYVDGGAVIDPEAKVQVGAFTLGTNTSRSLVAPDVGHGVVTFLEWQSAGMSYALRGYDPNTFQRVSSVDLPNISGTASSFMPTLAGQFAFRTDSGQVILFSQGPVVSHGLRITAQGPDGPVVASVAIDTPDLDGLTSGTTPFTRRYLHGTTIRLTAPAAVGNLVLRAWLNAGSSSSPVLATTVTAGTTLTAVYRHLAPVLTAIRPTVGPLEGGTTLTLTGANFQPGAVVWMVSGWIPATFVDANTLTVTTPPDTAEVVSVSVANPDAQAVTLPSCFAYRGALAFTDDPLQAGVTAVKAVHLTELRQAIANLRAQYGLAPMTWTDPNLVPRSALIKATHLAELRTALSDLYLAAGRQAPAFSAAPVAGVTVVTAAQLAEIRAAIAALW